MKYYKTEINSSGNIAVDDMILVKDVEACAGSRILEGFKPLFSAEVVEKLQAKGYKISGKTNVGEFGLDLAGEFSCYGEKEETIKGAAAEAVASGSVKAALGVDMNGSTRRSAALSGISFLKPTYATVSRYGIISCAASGEQVGVYAKDTEGIKKIMTVIAGHDDKDGTSLPEKEYVYDNKMNVSGMNVCVIKELLDKADDCVKAEVNAYIDALKENGVEVTEISCDLFEVANTAWQILMCAETCNNVSRYDGVKYGYRASGYKNIDELYVKTRTEGFNFLTKAVILYGSEALSKNRYKECYDKSLRVRRIVAEEMAKLFEEYDALLTPVCSAAEYKKYDIADAFEKVYGESVFTAVANLIGAPALASGKVQLIGKNFAESTLLSLANCVERKGE